MNSEEVKVKLAGLYNETPHTIDEKGVARNFHEKEFFLDDESERCNTCRITSELEDV